MHTVQVRDAKARLSALIEAAERGEPTTITRHGRPSFADLLLSFPEQLEVERDRTPPRDIDL